MAHKKAAGSAKNLRDSNPKFRGVKLSGGQSALAGNIIIRQKGDKYMCGNHTYKGKDFTIHAQVDGVVSFRQKRFMRFDGRKYIKTVVDILPAEGAASAKSSVASKAQKASVKKTTKKQTTKKEQPKTTASDTKKATKTTKAKTTTAKSTSTNTTKKKSSGDDFTKIKGIDSVISDLLHANGITSFDKLSSAKVGDLRDILADNDLTTHEPMPWKKQATLAKNEKWDELKEYQDTV